MITSLLRGIPGGRDRWRRPLWREPGHFRAGALVIDSSCSTKLTLTALTESHWLVCAPGRNHSWRHYNSRVCWECCASTDSDRWLSMPELIDTAERNGRTVDRFRDDAPLPGWLRPWLADAVLLPPQSGADDEVETSHPVPWPRLVREHPKELLVDHNAMRFNDGATWGRIAASFELLTDKSAAPALTVSVRIRRTGEVMLWPFTLEAANSTCSTPSRPVSSRANQTPHHRCAIQAIRAPGTYPPRAPTDTETIEPLTTR